MVRASMVRLDRHVGFNRQFSKANSVVSAIGSLDLREIASIDLFK